MKTDICLLGATGTVGQKFIQILEDHPLFDLKMICASENSAGKKYADACAWKLKGGMPAYVRDMTVYDCSVKPTSKLILSALDSSAAGKIEADLERRGHIVISNAKNHRMRQDVPIIIPEINPGHINIKPDAEKGAIITNPNCSTAGLALALYPLHKAYGLRAAHVVTMQAISGAGYPGVPAWDITGNVIPGIDGEEEKISSELIKILGKRNKAGFSPLDADVSASCNRVPVPEGHMLDIAVRLYKHATKEEIIGAWRDFKGEANTSALFSAPEPPVRFLPEKHMPRPSLFNDTNGMTVFTGNLRDCAVYDYKFTALVHNTVRGAAGNAILIAELILRDGWI